MKVSGRQSRSFGSFSYLAVTMAVVVLSTALPGGAQAREPGGGEVIVNLDLKVVRVSAQINPRLVGPEPLARVQVGLGGRSGRDNLINLANVGVTVSSPQDLLNTNQIANLGILAPATGEALIGATTGTRGALQVIELLNQLPAALLGGRRSGYAGKLPDTLISLGGRSLITANLLAPAFTAAGVPSQVSASTNAGTQASIFTATLPTLFTFPQVNSASLVPNDLTATVGQPGSSDDPGLQSPDPNGDNGVPSSPKRKGGTDISDGPGMDPIVHTTPAITSEAETRITTARAGNALIMHTGRARFESAQPGSLSLESGEMLIQALDDTLIRCGNDWVSLQRGSIVLVMRQGAVVKVHNLHELRAKSARVLFNDGWVTVSAGEEIVVASDHSSFSRSMRGDQIGRRLSQSFVSEAGKILVHSEFSAVTLMNKNVLLTRLSRSQNERALMGKLMKTAACLVQVTAHHGRYAIVSDPSQLTGVDRNPQL